MIFFFKLNFYVSLLIACIQNTQSQTSDKRNLFIQDLFKDYITIYSFVNNFVYKFIKINCQIDVRIKI